MKKLILLLTLFLFLGCKTKQLTVEKLVEIEKQSLSMQIDSLSIVKLKSVLDLETKKSEFQNNFSLKSYNLLDSAGNAIPLHYKHFVNGKLKEEIYLQGGELIHETVSKQENNSKKENLVLNQTKRIEVDVGFIKVKENSKLIKNKKIEVKGFQFGFYLWLLLIVIIIFILNHLNKKFNLFEKFKSILNITEV